VAVERRVDSSADSILAFYSGGRDRSGRTLAGILAWDDERLEAVHDYIQWVFPTRQPSGVNPLAPLVTDVTVQVFADDAALRDRLREALDRMLIFFGLARSGDRVAIDALRFPVRARVWLHPGNHNHLRLTRIMESLATLGLRADALALQRCLLEDIVMGPGVDLVSPRTAGFWKHAVSL
jgi:Opioid growth factor receptor (OGFr) conserved region